MHNGKLIFAQIMEFIPKYEFQKCVNRYKGNHKIRNFSCWDQYLCMSFAQLTHRESLRDIEASLRCIQGKLYHMGIRSRISRSTLADANEKRDWRIYADFSQVLISQARVLYRDKALSADLDNTVYALDSTMIDLCLSLFPWSKPNNQKLARGSIKLHTLLDLRGNIPSFIKITHSVVRDNFILDEIIPEPGSFYVMDRGYVDFKRIYRFQCHSAFFVMRMKNTVKFRRIYSHPINRLSNIRYDQTVALENMQTYKKYPENLRRIRVTDKDTQKDLVLVTNNFFLPSATVADLYRCRWQIELFFKWIKQHLRINAFYGNSLNAVKTQIWIAVSVYVLVAIIAKKLKLGLNLYTILQILSITPFEKDELYQLLTNFDRVRSQDEKCNQLELFEL